ncbi:alpha-ketoglutarate-dependent dioxygenase AlkB [Sphingobium yanoikuyae]|uniref:alpha-ketoglutarate-dependent dioxygenase AlkB n=1 Tax=Sphingobium yanoikuyae TaxID=13690 RepID=UPI0028A77D8B|nr:alpha-ketoglutarate-dependent dioxygenase AlkB [Sphingobium yanoikuyae]
MLDLFDAPLIPGLASQAELVSPAEERSLVDAIDAQPLSPFRFQGWEGKRLTHSFGWNYDFDTGEVARAAPMPDWLIAIRHRVSVFAGIDPDQLVQALLIRYDVGAGIGWHRDRPIYEHVVGLSLGAPAVMRFRRKHVEKWQRVNLPLPPRGAYHLSEEARHAWEHSIVEMEEVRHSITFRSPSDRGRALLTP